MSAANDANNAAFSAAGGGEPAKALDFGDDVIAMHGVFNGIARYENVAIHIRKSDVRNHEAVAVLVKHKAAADFIARTGSVLRDLVGGGIRGVTTFFRRRRRARRLAEEEAAVGKFLDEAAFLELEEHLKERSPIGPAGVEALGEVLEGDGVVSKLKETKDVIGTEPRRARHGAVPFWERRVHKVILVTFFKFAVTFFRFAGFHR